MKYGPMEEERLDLGAPGDAVFVVCEGNFMYGNASLSCYIPSEKLVVNEVFARANAIDLGDVAQSMTIHDGRGYVVVNNSGIVFIIDPSSGRVTGTIGPLGSPRYILPLNDTKAYVSDLYASAITIVDPSSGRVTGHIPTPGHPSTEQMVEWGGRVYVNCWSYDDVILTIDTATDTVVGRIEVGPQPTSLAIDRNGKLWTLTGGGFAGTSVNASEAPALWRIDAATLTVERRFDFAPGDNPTKLCLNGDRDTLYYIAGTGTGMAGAEDGPARVKAASAVWRMAIGDQTLPAAPSISPDPAALSLFYALGVDPRTSEVYVGDAIGYSQPGVVYRYSPQGELIDKFRTGIIPGAFCFY